MTPQWSSCRDTKNVKNFNKVQSLSPDQKDILKRFIITFLPQRGNKRKGRKNEIEYIDITLDRIFNTYFNFSFTRKQLLNAFEELQYPIFLKSGKWNADKKEHIPSNKGTAFRMDEGYKDYKAAFIYIDLEPSIVGQLRLVTAGLPPNTNIERVKEKEEMLKRIHLFKQTI